MADTRVVFPACPCPTRTRLRRLAPSYTFTGCLLRQAFRDESLRPGRGSGQGTGQPNTACENYDANTGISRGSRDGARLKLHHEILTVAVRLSWSRLCAG